MSKILIYLILLVAFSTGCKTPEHRDYLGGIVTKDAASRVSLGMPREDVISLLGTPLVGSAYENVEFLRYRVSPGSVYGYSYMGPQHANYYVKLEDGKVSEYGRLGDFGSTRNPTMNLNVRVEE